MQDRFTTSECARMLRKLATAGCAKLHGAGQSQYGDAGSLAAVMQNDQVLQNTDVHDQLFHDGIPAPEWDSDDQLCHDGIPPPEWDSDDQLCHDGIPPPEWDSDAEQDMIDTVVDSCDMQPREIGVYQRIHAVEVSGE